MKDGNKIKQKNVSCSITHTSFIFFIVSRSEITCLTITEIVVLQMD